MNWVAPAADIGSEEGLVYHATNEERAAHIATEGLRTHRPWEGTEQDVWPDGSTEKRAYFSSAASTVWAFAPETGRPVILRTPQQKWFKRESTGDIYTTRKVPADDIEILTTEGWVPIAGAFHGALESNPARTLDELPSDVRIGVVEDFDEDTNRIRAFTVYYADEAGHPLPSSRESVDDQEPERFFSGVVRAHYRAPCDAFEVVYSIVAPGWGPLLYDIAMELASRYGGGLMSDRESVSPDACRLWRHYLDAERRPDVQRRLLPERNVCKPGAACAIHYALTKSPETLNRLERSRPQRILYFDDRPPGLRKGILVHPPDPEEALAKPRPLAANAKRTWGVEVWFATSPSYRLVAHGLSREAATREAYQYWSDSRGIRLVSSSGDVVEVKPETKMINNPEERDIQRAAQLLSFMDEKEAHSHLMDSGMSDEDAFLAIHAARVMLRDVDPA